MAIGNGVEQQVQDQFKTLSVNNVFVAPDGEDSKLSSDDIDVVLQSPYVTSASVNIDGSFQASNSLNNTVETFITQWVKENYFNQFNMELDVWRIFEDGNTTERVAVLGVEVVEDLFEVEDPKLALWETVTIKSKKFRVIWVLKEVGVSFGPFSYDSTIYLPLWAMKRYLVKGDLTTALSAVIDNVENMEAAKEDISERLRETYNIKKDDTDWFILIDAGATIWIATDVAKVLSFLLLGISIFILIVSGIWIMNVMFAGVAERTKEIGILKSIWASKKHIQTQFLLESVLITLLSGSIWIILAEIIISLAIYFWAPFGRNLRGDLLALLFACGTWIISGRYPAVRASQLDPVDALRS